jgi:hypothetical protein
VILDVTSATINGKDALAGIGWLSNETTAIILTHQYLSDRNGERWLNDSRRYAVVGAEQRLLELAEDAARIFAIFPGLRVSGENRWGPESAAPARNKPVNERGGAEGISEAQRA